MKNPKNTSSKSAAVVKGHRKKVPSVENLVAGILKGDKTALARAITLVESTQKDDTARASAIIEACINKAGNSFRIGITGVPGVGKSTFIEALGKKLLQLGKKVAVLAVDPSSTLSKGSILGDKTRMQDLVKEANAYIRPSPSRENLGGVARRTREAIILCEAAGYDLILIETVGVGQSETAVYGMVDFFLLLQLAGAGDELQGIKRGIMEMADAVVINKADGSNIAAARHAKVAFERALHLYPPKESGWVPKVLTCSAKENVGITELWEMVAAYLISIKKSGFLLENRRKQNSYWLLQTAEALLKARFYDSNVVKKQLPGFLQKVETNNISPFQAAQKLLESYLKELK